MQPKSHPISKAVLGPVIQIAMCASAAAHPTNSPALVEQNKEIALALSACPPSLASGAAVYALGRSGYVKVRESQNGFTAIVQHSLPAAQEPQCMDAEGARTILPRILRVAELRAEGKSPEEIKQFVADAFAKGIFRPPARLGVNYMLSSHNVVPLDDKGTIGPFPPHVMFYAPYLSNADLGAENLAWPAFVAAPGTPGALIIVPVPPAAAMAGGHEHR